VITNNSNQIDQTITKLDDLLIDGYSKHKTQKSYYFDNRSISEFDINKYLQDTTGILNDWYRTVVKILNEEVTDKHHLFHFLQHKGDSMSLIGVPQNISNLLISFEYYLYSLEDIILRLSETRNLTIRQEIAEKESQTDILYKITYNSHKREVRLNNIVIAKPDFTSENDKCFNFIYNNPNRPITLKEIETAIDDTVKKRLAQVVQDLGFSKDIKDMFFPGITKTSIMFVNPITKQYAIENELRPLNLKQVEDRVCQSKTE